MTGINAETTTLKSPLLKDIEEVIQKHGIKRGVIRISLAKEPVFEMGNRVGFAGCAGVSMTKQIMKSSHLSLNCAVPR